MSAAPAEMLERHRPGYIAALLEHGELCLTDPVKPLPSALSRL
jgi:hypothetical protein